MRLAAAYGTIAFVVRRSGNFSSIRVRLIVGLAIGLAAGLLYGWVIQPVEFVDTTPDSLRQDYRTDYVLMVAEVYQDQSDLAAAQRRLAVLGPSPPAETVAAASDYAETQQFAETDLDRMQALLDALQRRGATPEIGGP
ncbi:MAG: hypothetical protein WBR18_14310 [Anaerolineales bacterium]